MSAAFTRRQAIALKARFGITLAEFQALKRAQRNRCAVCRRKPDRLHVDHCHRTRRVRGLLCMPCNTAIGALGDSPKRIRAAAAYLEASR